VDITQAMSISIILPTIKTLRPIPLD